MIVTPNAALINSHSVESEFARGRTVGCWSNGLLAERLRGAGKPLDEVNAAFTAMRKRRGNELYQR